jgi:acyl dehydratase
MSLDQAFSIGETMELGSHTFEADEIKDFAGKFDPQPFHLSEEGAANSVFGRLCASGWHTASMWMHYNVPSFETQKERAREAGIDLEFGPAAGITDLRWSKPVYVGDTITYYRKPESHRPLSSRPGWHMITARNWGVNQHGETVIEFVANVLMRAG